jgi:hypothetical protein
MLDRPLEGIKVTYSFTAKERTCHGSMESVSHDQSAFVSLRIKMQHTSTYHLSHKLVKHENTYFIVYSPSELNTPVPKTLYIAFVNSFPEQIRLELDAVRECPEDRGITFLKIVEFGGKHSLCKTCQYDDVI